MRSIFVAFVAALSVSAAASSEVIPLIQPKEAGVHLLRKGDGSATFSGQLVVSGTLVAKWWAAQVKVADAQPDYELVPDARSKKLLPHYSGYAVRTIELLNGPEALELIAGAALARKLANREVLVVKAKGTFVLDSYEVGVECDAPWSKAKVVKVQKRGAARVLGPLKEDGC